MGRRCGGPKSGSEVSVWDPEDGKTYTAPLRDPFLSRQRALGVHVLHGALTTLPGARVGGATGSY